jgi:hypothetical protein
MKYFPYRNDGMFPENDSRWIRDWGFEDWQGHNLDRTLLTLLQEKMKS